VALATILASCPSRTARCSGNSRLSIALLLFCLVSLTLTGHYAQTPRARSRSMEHVGGATLGQTCHSQELGEDLHS
jgi:hypothetical protein